MTVGELIAQLKQLNPTAEVAVLDGFNGGGQPRALNFGPTEWDKDTLEEMTDFDMTPDYSDLKSAPGTPIVVLGYGCY